MRTHPLRNANQNQSQIREILTYLMAIWGFPNSGNCGLQRNPKTRLAGLGVGSMLRIAGQPMRRSAMVGSSDGEEVSPTRTPSMPQPF